MHLPRQRFVIERDPAAPVTVLLEAKEALARRALVVAIVDIPQGLFGGVEQQIRQIRLQLQAQVAEKIDIVIDEHDLGGMKIRLVATA